MNIEQIIQLGFAASVATYLLITLVKDVKRSQSKILEILECIAVAVKAKRK